jgi:autotransporter-associated beta strand protein
MKVKPQITISLMRRLLASRRARTLIAAFAIAIVIALGVDVYVVLAADQFWNTNGASATWTALNWGTSAAGPFTNGWTSNNVANFTANSAITYVSTTNVGGITVTNGSLVTLTPAGTFTTGGASRTFDVGTGSILDFSNQAISTAAGTGLIKSGDGIFFTSNASAYPGGFTLNAGTVIVGAVNALGNGGALTINGGTLAANATRNITSRYSSIVVGGDFTIGSVTSGVPSGNGSSSANITFADNIGLGASTRSINIGSNGIYTFGGVISGNSGSGLTITRAVGATGNITLTGINTYTGNTTISAGTLALSGSGSIANSPTITVAGGATFDVSGLASTLTLGSTQTLDGSGTTSSGMIKCGSSGLTLGSTSPLTLLYANGNPTLTVTGGALTLASGNPVTITVSGSALTAGDYTLISSSLGGSVAGAAPTTVTVAPGGLASGMAASLQIAGGQLILNVASPTAANGNVSGQIVDSSGNPVEGAAVRMSGTQNRLTVTDAAGNYYFDNVETNGFYTVVPTRANFSFSPSQRVFSQLGQHTDAAFTATLTGGGLNPLDTTEYFVRQQYVDFLNREPDESGFNFWVNNIESCGTDANCRAVKRIDTSAAFFLSIEFQRTGYLVYRTYQAAYGDLPNAPVPIRLNEFKPDTQKIGNGVIVLQSGWEQQLESNKQAYAAEFVQRARFVLAYPATMTAAEFVDQLFTNAAVTPAGNDRLAAINEFGSASTTSDVAARGRALRRVTGNSLLAQQEFNQAFVLMEYFGYLQRDANNGPDTDFSGYNFWLDKLNTFGGNYQNADMIKAFLVSGEYRGRFPR